MKKELLEQNTNLVSWFIKMGQSRNSSMQFVIGEMYPSIDYLTKKSSLYNAEDKTYSLKCEQSFS